MYLIFAIVSGIIRSQYLPNPFESWTHGYSFNIFIAEPLLHIITFIIVGLYYTKGSNPLIGSILYLLFYIIHVGLLFTMGAFQWNVIAIVCIFVLYFVVHLYINIKINSIS